MVRMRRTNIHPKTTQHLTSAETFHQRVQLCNCSRQGCAIYLVRLEFNKRTSRVLMLVPRLCQKDGLSTLRACIRIVSVCCIRVAYNAKFSMKWPKTKICWLKLDGPYKFVQCSYVSDRRSCSTRCTP